MRPLAGLSKIAGDYDGFIVDLWGVVHNGVVPYPAALEALRALRGRPVLLLSNAPRRAASAQAMLRRMDIADDVYSGILTSGELTWLALRDRTDPWFAKLGRRAFHLGPVRDRPIFDGLDVEVVDTPGDADFVLNTGPDETVPLQTVHDFETLLASFLYRGLPMVCANPDRLVLRDSRPIVCAGALAERYQALGGDVRSIGKPDPMIYRAAFAAMGEPSHVLAIGDSLHTDIAGAQAAGLDALWILDGIHAGDAADMARANALAAGSGLFPFATMHRLSW